MSSNRVMVLNRDSDEFIEIDPTTDCFRCGTKVMEEGGLPDFKICPFHCVSCPAKSMTPNKIGVCRGENDVEFRGPTCKECYPWVYAFTTTMDNPDAFLVKPGSIIKNRDKADQKPDVDY